MHLQYGLGGKIYYSPHGGVCNGVHPTTLLPSRQGCRDTSCVRYQRMYNMHDDKFPFVSLASPKALSGNCGSKGSKLSCCATVLNVWYMVHAPQWTKREGKWMTTQHTWGFVTHTLSFLFIFAWYEFPFCVSRICITFGRRASFSAINPLWPTSKTCHSWKITSTKEFIDACQKGGKEHFSSLKIPLLPFTINKWHPLCKKNRHCGTKGRS